MGGLTRSLFGGSKNKQVSESGNNAFSFLMDKLGSSVGQGGTAMSAIGDFLGLGGEDGTARASQGVQNFMNSAGFKNILEGAQRGVVGSNAAKGLFQSGATGRRLAEVGGEIAQQGAQNYLGNLQGLAQLGQGAAGIIGGAGGFSKSIGKGSSSGGIIPGLFG